MYIHAYGHICALSQDNVPLAAAERIAPQHFAGILGGVGQENGQH